MRGFIAKRGPYFVPVVDHGEISCRRCETCRKNYFDARPPLACPKCGGGLVESVRRWNEWRHDLKSKKRGDAKNSLTELLHAGGKGAYVSRSKLSLTDYLRDHWFPAVKGDLAVTTSETYRLVIEAYIVRSRIGRIAIQDLDTPTLNAYYSELSESGGRNGKGLASKTIRHCHTLLRKALGDAVQWGFATRNPADSARPPKVQRSRSQNLWSGEQLGKFLDETADHRLHAAFVVLATTGLRREELLGLRWKDRLGNRISVTQTCVSVKSKPVLVLSTKTDSGARSIALDPLTVAALDQHRVRQTEERLAFGSDYRDHDLIFANPDGSPINPSWFTREVKRVALRLGLPAITPHLIRHSYATLALSGREVDIKILSARLGHSSTVVTREIYQHVSAQMDEEAAEKMASLIFKRKAE